MADLFSYQPPEWIGKSPDTKLAGHVLGTAIAGGVNALRNQVSYGQGLDQARRTQADPMWAVKEKHLESQMLARNAALIGTLSTIAAKNRETAAFTRDLPKANAYLEVLVKDPSAPPPEMESAQGTRMVAQMQSQAARGFVAKSLTQSRTEYDKRLGKLIQADREAGADLTLPPQQFPSAMNWRALELGEERAQIRAQNRAKQAELEAIQRGEVPSGTTINPKGEATLRFAPPSASGTEVVPKEATLTDGTQIIYNPKTGHFILKKDKQEMKFTAPQLLAIAQARKKEDEKDPNAQTILDFLGSAATNQIAPPSPSPAPAPAPTQPTPSQNDPLGLFK